MRTYRCPECPPDACDHEAGARGPLPDRCPDHRRVREAKQARRRRSGLRSVGPDDVPAAAAVPAAPPAVEHRPGPATPTLDALRADLDDLVTTHPAQQTLSAAALALAAAIDSPLTGAIDVGKLPALVRELRATLHELTAHEEAGDDLFGDESAGPVVVAAPA